MGGGSIQVMWTRARRLNRWPRCATTRRRIAARLRHGVSCWARGPRFFDATRWHVRCQERIVLDARTYNLSSQQNLTDKHY